MSEISMSVPLFKMFADAYAVGASGGPQYHSLETYETVNEVIERASKTVPVSAASDSLHSIVFNLDAAGMEWAQTCFQVGAEDNDSIHFLEWHAINELFHAPRSSFLP